MKLLTLKQFGVILILFVGSYAKAEVRLNNIFSNHMVLQRQIENPVWGTADAGEKISVSFAGLKYSTITDKDVV